MKSFFIIGIPLTTTNQDAANSIPALWQKFFTIKDSIPNKVEPEVIYGMYTDYQNREKDIQKTRYTLIVGCEVTSLNEIPSGMVGITVPEQTYQVFSVNGPPEKAVFETWQQIWKTPIDRAFTYDFERYGDKTEIYIAV